MDGEQSCGAVVDSGLGGLWVGEGVGVGFPPPPPPHHPSSQNEPGTIGQLPKPLLDNNMGKQRPQKRETGRRERVIRWPPLWECCKLCFPEALGIPNQSWNLQAWKRRPASLERGDVSWRTSVDHLVGELAVTHFLYCANRQKDGGGGGRGWKEGRRKRFMQK